MKKNRTIIKLPKILLGGAGVNYINKQTGISKVTIRKALKFESNSKNSVMIRQMAKDFLLKEAKKIDTIKVEY